MSYYISYIGIIPISSKSIFLSFFFFKSFIEAQLIDNVVIIYAIQQSDSVIHVHTSMLFQILFPHRLSQNTG